LYFKNRKIVKKIIFIERASDILQAVPDGMKSYVARNLKSMGVEVLTNSVIEKISTDKLLVSGGREFRRPILIWVAGVKTARFIQKLNLPKNPQGRIVVDGYLRVSQNCFCAGDAAYFKEKNSFLRMAIQFAITQGDRAAKNIARSIKNIPLKKYRPLDLGYIIPRPNNKSCGRILGLNVSGRLATLLHFIMCIFRSIGWKNKAGIINSLIKAAFCRKAEGSKKGGI
jgi:NADH dehydrogenase FAD-containing subunit